MEKTRTYIAIFFCFNFWKDETKSHEIMNYSTSNNLQYIEPIVLVQMTQRKKKVYITILLHNFNRIIHCEKG